MENMFENCGFELEFFQINELINEIYNSNNFNELIKNDCKFI
jgi:hypothetical protein